MSLNSLNTCPTRGRESGGSGERAPRPARIATERFYYEVIFLMSTQQHRPIDNNPVLLVHFGCTDRVVVACCTQRCHQSAPCSEA